MRAKIVSTSPPRKFCVAREGEHVSRAYSSTCVWISCLPVTRLSGCSRALYGDLPSTRDGGPVPQELASTTAVLATSGSILLASDRGWWPALLLPRGWLLPESTPTSLWENRICTSFACMARSSVPKKFSATPLNVRLCTSRGTPGSGLFQDASHIIVMHREKSAGIFPLSAHAVGLVLRRNPLAPPPKPSAPSGISVLWPASKRWRCLDWFVFLKAKEVWGGGRPNIPWQRKYQVSNEWLLHVDFVTQTSYMDPIATWIQN